MSSVKYFDIDEDGLLMLKHIEEELDKVNFGTSGNRMVLTHNNSRPMSMPMGMKRALTGDYLLPTFDKKNPHIYPLVVKFVNKYAPDFDYNCGYVNKNVQMIPHKDKSNIDSSIIFGLGNYTGGRLYVEGEPHDIKYKMLEFDGKREEHWTEYFEGTRYSMIMFKI